MAHFITQITNSFAAIARTCVCMHACPIGSLFIGLNELGYTLLNAQPSFSPHGQATCTQILHLSSHKSKSTEIYCECECKSKNVGHSFSTIFASQQTKWCICGCLYIIRIHPSLYFHPVTIHSTFPDCEYYFSKEQRQDEYNKGMGWYTVMMSANDLHFSFFHLLASLSGPYHC